MSDALRTVLIWLIPICPLAAAVSIACVGKTLFRCRGYHVAVAALVVSCILSLGQLARVAFSSGAKPATAATPGTSEHSSQAVLSRGESTRTVPLARGYDWISIGGLHVRLDTQIDALSAVMLTMVTFVSMLVMIYAGGYMRGDPGYSRFFAEMSLFVFSMCMLVLARNFLVLFIFWEGVGLCSYLLISFWFERPTAAAAAVKAFVMNRIGDAAFLVAMFLIWRRVGSLDFADAFRAAPHFPPNEMLTICLCLFAGACGKSAQFPLHLWLPDAMEGPTPVSALIHAATMVTAGVYLVARCTPLFVLAPFAQAVVATIGGVTALLGALIALTQTDLKRVLAYSTISQLGYMFLALGSAVGGEGVVTAAVVAAIFHMFTHAFFKALLFLSSGNVMHAMGNVIDMRRFGGLRQVLPVTNGVFLCGALALAGIPPLSGFWSKDDIVGLLSAGSLHEPYGTLFRVLFISALVTALLTAFYTFRAYFLTFWGPLRIPPEAFAHAHHDGCALPHAETHATSHAQNHAAAQPAQHAAVRIDHGPNGHVPSGEAGDPSQVHEGGKVMTWPLIVLAVFAAAVGLVIGPTHLFTGWVAQTPTLGAGEEHGIEWGLAGLSTLLAAIGIGAAALMYARPTDLPERVRSALGPLYQLSVHKFYLDDIAALLVVFPINALAFLSLVADQGVVDRFVDTVAGIPPAIGRLLRPVQNGVIQSYALVMLFGLAIFLTMVIQVWVVRFP